MKKQHKPTKPDQYNEQENQFPGYPPYPESDDIYNRFKKEGTKDPENLSQTKSPNEPADAMNEKDFPEIVNGDDLDIPGAELDDEQETIGSEDEENNYYSLGGDNHTDLDEREDPRS